MRVSNRALRQGAVKARKLQMIIFTANNTRARDPQRLGDHEPDRPPPAANSALNEVFMPSAAIAATRHQRDTSLARSMTIFGKQAEAN